MRVPATLFGALVSSFLLVASEGQQAPSPTPHTDFKCEVTKPNDVAAGEEKPARGSYGNREVSVGPFGLWPDGTIEFKPGGAGFVTQSGALGMKFGWMRGVSGDLKITGHRLDGEGPPLRSQVPAGYGDRGFQATYLIFPTPGCWEVTGHVGDSSVTFVTKVVKIGNGPDWKLDVP
jgi:hypothetical protein